MTAIFRGPGRPVVRRLAEAAGLPTADLDQLELSHFFGAGTPEAPVGIVGLELMDNVGLLRSLAVDQAARGTGVGQALVAAAERHAREEGVAVLYLLTTTAAGFFDRLGYAPADRDGLPAAIRSTREFREICPASAVAMAKTLTPDAGP
jgi:amino-acid N-acetyltransferase